MTRLALALIAIFSVATAAIADPSVTIPAASSVPPPVFTYEFGPTGTTTNTNIGNTTIVTPPTGPTQTKIHFGSGITVVQPQAPGFNPAPPVFGTPAPVFGR